MPSSASNLPAVPGGDAFYIDFEGEQNGAPVLLGVLGQSEALGDSADFRQFVFDPDLQRVGTSRSTSHGPCVSTTAVDALRALRNAVEATGRPVVAWSSYEQSAILELLAGTTETSFWDGRMVDAKALAKKWKRRNHRDVVFPLTRGSGRHALRHYQKLIDYRLPPTQQGGNTGQRIRAVRDAVQKRGDYASLTPTQKRKWSSLLEHNWHDCNGMRELMLVVARDT